MDADSIARRALAALTGRTSSKSGELFGRFRTLYRQGDGLLLEFTGEPPDDDEMARIRALTGMPHGIICLPALEDITLKDRTEETAPPPTNR